MAQHGFVEYLRPRGGSEKVSVKEKTIHQPSYTAAEDAKARRDPGQMSLYCTRCTNTTYTLSTSQLHTDETPKARYLVMTQALIAFPPAEGIVECITMVHYYTATAEDGKILVVINTAEEMNPFLPLQ